MLHNSPNKSYLEIWHRIFTNNEVMAESQNIIHIFEILMIVPFTNAIVEHFFSRVNRVNNRLSRSRLDTGLHVREEGPSIKDFVSDHFINRWWTEKERCLKSCPNNYPAKKHPHLNSTEYVDLSTLMMSDLENSDDEECFPYSYTWL